MGTGIYKNISGDVISLEYLGEERILNAGETGLIDETPYAFQLIEAGYLKPAEPEAG
jgi:hypothetical protein